MDSDAQHLYVNSMLTNPEIFTLVNGILRPDYFDPDIGKGIKFMQDYFVQNRTVPPAQIFTTATKLPFADSPLHDAQDRNYIATQIAEFCKFQSCINVLKKAMGKDGYLETGDLGKMVNDMKEATEIGLLQDLGINYFDNPAARLEADEIEDPVISTGWKSVDDVIGGGIGLQELVVFLAPSGGGKSVSMLNLALNLNAQGYAGIYISLEMRDKKVARRTDQMMSRFHSNLINANRTQVVHEIQKFHEKSKASFHIKRLPEGRTTAAHIRAYIKHLKASKQLYSPFGPKLGFVVVDYLDIMGSEQKVNGDNMFLKDKYVSEEVRSIGFDEDCIVISASQLEKGATKLINDGEKMHQGNVQGGSSKTNTADLMIATVKTDAMHEAGEYRFEFPKARNSDAGTKQVTMAWNKSSLRITDMTGESSLAFRPKRGLQMPASQPGAKREGLNDLQKRFGTEG